MLFLLVFAISCLSLSPRTSASLIIREKLKSRFKGTKTWVFDDISSC